MRSRFAGLTILSALFWMLSQTTAGCSSDSSPAPEPLPVGSSEPGHADRRPAAPASAGPAAEVAPGSTDSAAVHHSAIAGSWYPDDPGKLRRLLEDTLSEASGADTGQAAALVALVVPHAGYAYSARTAAHAYQVLRERKPGRVLFLGPSHHGGFRGIAVGDYRGFETPLGVAPVDHAGVEHVKRCPLNQAQPRAHEPEHSLDIQVPFLQVLFPGETPPIVPVLVGRLEEADLAAAAACLRGLLDERTVVVVSSDFTHYGPRFQYLPFPLDAAVGENLRKLDQGAASRILGLDLPGFLTYRRQTGITVCGWAPVALLLELLPRDTHGRELCYQTSGQLTGDFENSVSYYALAFYRPSLWAGQAPRRHAENLEGSQMTKKKEPDPPPACEADSLSDAEKDSLLRLARDTVEQYVREKKAPDPMSPEYAVSPRLKEMRGAFVTLKKHGQLRGCIGYIQPIEPLCRTIKENAVNAACRDSRFPPVKPSELADIEIEISALTKPMPVHSPREIELGRHGIILEKGGSKAVFLPQVAPEQGWNLEETLRHLSRKAGLSSDAWKDPETRFSVFRAEVFEEHRKEGVEH